MDNTYIPRYMDKLIETWLFKQKVIVLYGARRVGKTTMVQKLLGRFGDQSAYFNCDLHEVKNILKTQDPHIIKNYVGEKKIIIFDEAQQISEIGMSLKIVHDTFPELQIVATGSSSFDLANRVGEPLTGRSLTFTLYPLSLGELEDLYNRFEIFSQIEIFLIYGMYPDIILSDIKSRPIFLQNLVENYLYKDVLVFEQLKKPELLSELLRALALQVGSEVSLNELSVRLKCGVKTIVRYLDLLEKSFVIFRLRSFSRNLRNEIGKKFKVYFYDLGIRNALIDRFASLDRRDDIGALWKNFCIVERMKLNQKNGIFVNTYFWRTHTGKEIDYLEEGNGQIRAFEFKWKGEKYKAPKEFLDTYAVEHVQIVNRENSINFIF